MKRIIFILGNLYPGTGGFASIVEMINTASDLGHEVHILLIRYDPFFIYRKRVINILLLGNIMIHYLPGYKYALENDSTNKTIYHLVFSKFQNIVAELSFNNFKIFIESILVLIRRNNIQHFNKLLVGTDLIIKAAPISGIGLKELRNKTNAIIIQNHAGSPQTYENWLTKEEEPIGAKQPLSLYINFCRYFDKILFQSEDQAQDCANKHKDLIKKVITLYPTCNEDEIDGSISLDSPYLTNKQVIVNVGTIQPRKAQHRSIEAFSYVQKEYPNTQLHFIGSYRNKNYYNKLKKQIISRGLSNAVFFHGYKKDYLRYMINANILIQSSEFEGVSRVLREAMYMKLPIISFSISGTRAILKHNKDALLIEEKNTRLLGGALLKLLKDKSRAKELAESAFNRYQLKHSKRVYARNFEQILHADIFI